MFKALKQHVNDLYSKGHISTALQVMLTVVLVGASFYPVFAAQMMLRQSVSYAIARGAGASLKHLLPFLFFPMLRMINATIYRHVGPYFRNSLLADLFHKRAFLHKLLGLSFVVLASIHIIAHAFNKSVGLLATESISGFAMMGFLALPIAGISLFYSSSFFKNSRINRKSYYSQFLIPHQLGWWGLLAIFGLHTRDLRLFAWSASIVGVFSADRIWEWIKSKDVSVKKIDKIHDKMIIVEMDKPKRYVYQTGEKVYLAYPPGTAFRNKLHPFTIASSPNEPVLRFVISESGQWSQRLIHQLKVKDKIRVSPAFPSCLDNESQQKNERLFITSGSGLAVTLAHLQDSKDTSPISIIHTSRDPKEFSLFNRFVADKKYPIKSVNYFDTSDNYRSKLRSKSAPGTSLQKGRFIPGQNSLLTQFKGRIIFCGNEKIGEALEQVVAKDATKKLFKEKF